MASPTGSEFDAVVVGSGPNGLAAAIELARNGCSVCLFEADDRIGGGTRSAELTLPGFIHDICSAIHPLGIASPYFRNLPLNQHGLEWVHSPAVLAHPFDDGSAALLEVSIDKTCARLGGDAKAYSRLMSPLARHAGRVVSEVLAPVVHLPRHPLVLARFSMNAVRSAAGLANRRFAGRHARGLFAGIAAHSNMPLDRSPTAAFALLLGMLGHYVGWPLPKGGSQKIADSLASYFLALGGRIVTGKCIRSLAELPPARAILCDVSPPRLLAIAGDRFPRSYRRQLEHFQPGAGVFKTDWALRSPIPWKAEECARAATLHVGGTLEEIELAERTVAEGRHPERPFVLLAQPSLFDPARAPAGMQTVWSYCHVPNGSGFDMSERIAAQIERFAPGFRDCVIGKHTMSAQDFQAYNPNYTGGDISGGLQNIRQVVARPAWRLTPYSTPTKGLYICSSSTPPGGGVHGMCGYHAARAALRQL